MAETEIAQRLAADLLSGILPVEEFVRQFGEMHEEGVEAAFDILAPALADGRIAVMGNSGLVRSLETTAGIYPGADAALWLARNEHARTNIAEPMKPVLACLEMLMDSRALEDESVAFQVMRLLNASTTEAVRAVVQALELPAQNRGDIYGFREAKATILDSAWQMPRGLPNVAAHMKPFLAVHDAFFEILYEDVMAPITSLALENDPVAISVLRVAAGRVWPATWRNRLQSATNSGFAAVARFLEFPDVALNAARQAMRGDSVLSARISGQTTVASGVVRASARGPLQDISRDRMVVHPESTKEGVFIDIMYTGWEADNPSDSAPFTLTAAPAGDPPEGLEVEDWILVEQRRTVELPREGWLSQLPGASRIRICGDPESVAGGRAWVATLLDGLGLVAAMTDAKGGPA